MSIRSHVKLALPAAAVAAALVGALTSAGAGAASSKTYPSSACPQADGPAGGLEQCIAAASPGDTIKVKPGLYFESDIDVTKKITIQGYPCEEDDPAVIDASPPRPPAIGARDKGFDVQADDVTIGCLTIRHSFQAVDADQSSAPPVNNLRIDLLRTVDAQTGVDVNGDGFRIENSEFIGGDLNAIQANGNNGRVLKNRASQYGTGCYDLRGNTIRIESNTASLCEDGPSYRVIGNSNTIRKNTGRLSDQRCFIVNGDDNSVLENQAAGCRDGGFDISGANPVVEKNKATGGLDQDGFRVICVTTCHQGRVVGNFAEGVNNDDQGFEISVSPSTTPCSTVPFPCFRVTGNKATMNIESGFRLFISSSLISGNTATLNGAENTNSEEGLEVSGDDNLIEKNVLTANAFDGLQVSGNGNTIRENTASENGIDGIHLQSGSANTLDGNEVESNQGDGIENDGIATTITDNVSTENRADCVGDVPPASSSGNDCEDGTDFTTGGTID